MSNILIGVSGGIAAYKTPALARIFIKAGHSVRFMMTEEAARFIGPLTLAAVSGRRVSFSGGEEDSPVSHIELAKWADLCLVAPATANTIGKYASGVADSPFLSVLLALGCPVAFAPAMNCNMLSHPAVRSNIERIKSWGAHIIEPDEGDLACGDTGKGRMKDPEKIADAVLNILGERPVESVAPEMSAGDTEPETPEADGDKVKDILEEFGGRTLEEYLDNDETEEESLEGFAAGRPLEGLKILVTAGPTREYIDPVRYISNRSSGKMGYAVAHAALDMGADVTLVSGETGLVSRVPDTVIAVSGRDMAEAVEKRVSEYDILIMAAAVADYAPESAAPEKIKKEGERLSLELVKTKDILKEASLNKKEGQIFIGFAAETEDLEKNALKKLFEKNLDIIVANDVSRKDIGFDSDFNDVKLFFRDGKVSETGKRSKKDIAGIIVTEGAILAGGGK